MPRRRPAQLLPLIPASPAGWEARLQETPLLSVRAAGRQDRWLPTPRGPPQSIGRRAWPSPPAAPRTPRAGRRVDASRAPGTPALAGSRILPGRALLDGAAARRLAEAGRCPRCPGQLSGVWEPGRGEPARAGRGHVVAVRGREGLPTRGGPPSQSLSPIVSMEYYSATKRRKSCHLQQQGWIFEGIMLSEASRRETNTV